MCKQLTSFGWFILGKAETMTESTKRKPVATPSRALGLAPTLAPTVKPSCKVEVPSETIMPSEVPSAKSTPVKSPDLKKVRYEQPEVPIAPRALFQCGETTEVPFFKFKNWWGDVIHFTYHEYVVSSKQTLAQVEKPVRPDHAAVPTQVPRDSLMAEAVDPAFPETQVDAVAEVLQTLHQNPTLRKHTLSASTLRLGSVESLEDEHPNTDSVVPTEGSDTMYMSLSRCLFNGLTDNLVTHEYVKENLTNLKEVTKQWVNLREEKGDISSVDPPLAETCQVLQSEIKALNSDIDKIPELRVQFKQELENLKRSHDIMVDRLSEKLPMDEYNLKRGKVVEWHNSKRADVFKRYKEMDKQRETQEVLIETKLESLIGSAMVEWNAKFKPPEPVMDEFVSDLVAELENFLSLDDKQPPPEKVPVEVAPTPGKVHVEVAPTSGTSEADGIPQAWII